MKELMKFDALPFIYELKNTPNNDDGIPNVMPFSLTIDERYDLVKQEYNLAVDEMLTKAYKISSILGGNSTEDEIGFGYTNSILEFIERNYSSDFRNKKVLDIGCGTGYLLKQLKEKGFDVFGIEPGNQAKIGITKYSLPIVIDFFPSKEISQKFDLIISTLVLEHISVPETFLKNVKDNLVENGTVIIGVPNEEPYISTGDISTLFHEHWNYFTENSFYNFLKSNGAINIIIEKSAFGGLLYGKFNFSKVAEINENKVAVESILYLNKIEIATRKLKLFFKAHEGKLIGIYVPGRIINFLISEKISLSNIRFFDDDKNTYDHYFPGINIKVENFDNLLSEPTNIILIMSSFFGEKIKTKIVANTSLETKQIFIWQDIYNF